VESAQLRAKSRLCGPGPLHPVSPRCPDIWMRMEAVEEEQFGVVLNSRATRPTQAHRPKPVVPVKRLRENSSARNISTKISPVCLYTSREGFSGRNSQYGRRDPSANVPMPVSSSQAISDRPHAICLRRHEYRHRNRRATPFSPALPGASNAFPTQGQDVQGT